MVRSKCSTALTLFEPTTSYSAAGSLPLCDSLELLQSVPEPEPQSQPTSSVGRSP